MAYLRILELELDVLKGPTLARGGGSGVPAGLTDEARAALGRAADGRDARPAADPAKEDIDDLARRVRDVERALLDERDVERIARQVFADVLTAGDSRSSRRSRATPAATATLVDKPRR